MAASSSPVTPLLRSAESNAPVSTGGISSASQPRINRVASSLLRDWPASRRSSRAGQGVVDGAGGWGAAAMAAPLGRGRIGQFNRAAQETA